MLLACFIIAVLIIVAVIVYEFLVINKLMNESENRIMKMLDKAIDNVNIFIIGVWASLWSSNDNDDDELTD